MKSASYKGNVVNTVVEKKTKHAGFFDYENCISGCKCGWRSPFCDFFFRARALLEAHFEKIRSEQIKQRAV